MSLPGDKYRKKLNVFYKSTSSLWLYGLTIVSGDKEVKNIANFFILNPLETVMTFRSEKTGATTVEYIVPCYLLFDSAF